MTSSQQFYSQRFIRAFTTPTKAIFFGQNDGCYREKAERWWRICHKVRPSVFENAGEDIRDIFVVSLSSSRHQSSWKKQKKIKKIYNIVSTIYFVFQGFCSLHTNSSRRRWRIVPMFHSTVGRILVFSCY